MLTVAAALKSLLILPRDSTPPATQDPPEHRPVDELSLEEMREFIGQQQVRILCSLCEASKTLLTLRQARDGGGGHHGETRKRRRDSDDYFKNDEGENDGGDEQFLEHPARKRLRMDARHDSVRDVYYGERD